MGDENGGKMITVNFNPEIDKERTERILEEIRNDKMGGWVNWPQDYNKDELASIKAAAKKIQEESECLVCIGIGGSYLGHRAIIEALGIKSGIKIVYAGNSLSRRELERAMAELGDQDFSINVISKSGTTLEPAVAFETFKKKLVEKYGVEEAKQRVYATTDANTGVLHDEAVANGYTRFVVPDNIGGRYSVLTAVGLLPLAVAGINIDELLVGATESSMQVSFENVAAKYAWMRYALGARGYDTEIFASFEPATAYFNEWLKQLFGESECKDGKGIIPMSMQMSTDLHSMGQFLQDGRQIFFETVLTVEDIHLDISLEHSVASGKAVSMHRLNQIVEESARQAHLKNNTPNIRLTVSELSAKSFGYMVYFFETACAVSCYLTGVNPFDQPGVEAYKRNIKEAIKEV
mgnify:CR=1 FL=1